MQADGSHPATGGRTHPLVGTPHMAGPAPTPAFTPKVMPLVSTAGSDSPRPPLRPASITVTPDYTPAVTPPQSSTSISSSGTTTTRSSTHSFTTPGAATPLTLPSPRATLIESFLHAPPPLPPHAHAASHSHSHSHAAAAGSAFTTVPIQRWLYFVPAVTPYLDAHSSSSAAYPGLLTAIYATQCSCTCQHPPPLPPLNPAASPVALTSAQLRHLSGGGKATSPQTSTSRLLEMSGVASHVDPSFALPSSRPTTAPTSTSLQEKAMRRHRAAAAAMAAGTHAMAASSMAFPLSNVHAPFYNALPFHLDVASLPVRAYTTRTSKKRADALVHLPAQLVLFDAQAHTAYMPHDEEPTRHASDASAANTAASGGAARPATATKRGRAQLNRSTAANQATADSTAAADATHHTDDTSEDHSRRGGGVGRSPAVAIGSSLPFTFGPASAQGDPFARTTLACYLRPADAEAHASTIDPTAPQQLLSLAPVPVEEIPRAYRVLQHAELGLTPATTVTAATAADPMSPSSVTSATSSPQMAYQTLQSVGRSVSNQSSSTGLGSMATPFGQMKIEPTHAAAAAAAVVMDDGAMAALTGIVPDPAAAVGALRFADLSALSDESRIRLKSIEQRRAAFLHYVHLPANTLHADQQYYTIQDDGWYKLLIQSHVECRCRCGAPVRDGDAAATSVSLSHSASTSSVASTSAVSADSTNHRHHMRVSLRFGVTPPLADFAQESLSLLESSSLYREVQAKIANAGGAAAAANRRPSVAAATPPASTGSPGTASAAANRAAAKAQHMDQLVIPSCWRTIRCADDVRPDASVLLLKHMSLPAYQVLVQHGIETIQQLASATSVRSAGKTTIALASSPHVRLSLASVPSSLCFFFLASSSLQSQSLSSRVLKWSLLQQSARSVLRAISDHQHRFLSHPSLPYAHVRHESTTTTTTTTGSTNASTFAVLRRSNEFPSARWQADSPSPFPTRDLVAAHAAGHRYLVVHPPPPSTHSTPSTSPSVQSFNARHAALVASAAAANAVVNVGAHSAAHSTFHSHSHSRSSSGQATPSSPLMQTHSISPLPVLPLSSGGGVAGVGGGLVMKRSSITLDSPRQKSLSALRWHVAAAAAATVVTAAGMGAPPSPVAGHDTLVSTIVPAPPMLLDRLRFTGCFALPPSSGVDLIGSSLIGIGQAPADTLSSRTATPLSSLSHFNFSTPLPSPTPTPPNSMPASSSSTLSQHARRVLAWSTRLFRAAWQVFVQFRHERISVPLLPGGDPALVSTVTEYVVEKSEFLSRAGRLLNGDEYELTPGEVHLLWDLIVLPRVDETRLTFSDFVRVFCWLHSATRADALESEEEHGNGGATATDPSDVIGLDDHSPPSASFATRAPPLLPLRPVLTFFAEHYAWLRAYCLAADIGLFATRAEAERDLERFARSGTGGMAQFVRLRFCEGRHDSFVQDQVERATPVTEGTTERFHYRDLRDRRMPVHRQLIATVRRVLPSGEYAPVKTGTMTDGEESSAYSHHVLLVLDNRPLPPPPNGSMFIPAMLLSDRRVLLLSLNGHSVHPDFVHLQSESELKRVLSERASDDALIERYNILAAQARGINMAHLKRYVYEREERVAAHVTTSKSAQRYIRYHGTPFVIPDMNGQFHPQQPLPPSTTNPTAAPTRRPSFAMPQQTSQLHHPAHQQAHSQPQRYRSFVAAPPPPPPPPPPPTLGHFHMPPLLSAPYAHGTSLVPLANVGPPRPPTFTPSGGSGTSGHGGSSTSNLFHGSPYAQASAPPVMQHANFIHSHQPPPPPLLQWPLSARGVAGVASTHPHLASNMSLATATAQTPPHQLTLPPFGTGGPHLFTPMYANTPPPLPLQGIDASSSSLRTTTVGVNGGGGGTTMSLPNSSRVAYPHAPLHPNGAGSSSSSGGGGVFVPPLLLPDPGSAVPTPSPSPPPLARSQVSGTAADPRASRTMALLRGIDGHIQSDSTSPPRNEHARQSPRAPASVSPPKASSASNAPLLVRGGVASGGASLPTSSGQAAHPMATSNSFGELRHPRGTLAHYAEPALPRSRSSIIVRQTAVGSASGSSTNSGVAPSAAIVKVVHTRPRLASKTRPSALAPLAAGEMPSVTAADSSDGPVPPKKRKATSKMSSGSMGNIIITPRLRLKETRVPSEPLLEPISYRAAHAAAAEDPEGVTPTHGLVSSRHAVDASLAQAHLPTRVASATTLEPIAPVFAPPLTPSPPQGPPGFAATAPDSPPSRSSVSRPVSWSDHGTPRAKKRANRRPEAHDTPSQHAALIAARASHASSSGSNASTPGGANTSSPSGPPRDPGPPGMMGLFATSDPTQDNFLPRSDHTSPGSTSETHHHHHHHHHTHHHHARVHHDVASSALRGPDAVAPQLTPPSSARRLDSRHALSPLDLPVATPLRQHSLSSSSSDSPSGGAEDTHMQLDTHRSSSLSGPSAGVSASFDLASGGRRERSRSSMAPPNEDDVDSPEMDMQW